MSDIGRSGSRFGDQSPWVARAAIAVVVVIFAFTLAAPNVLNPPQKAPANTYTDWQLYRDIAKRVQAGQGYYRAAATEQRAHGYPTYPWATFRQPGQSLLLAALRTHTVQWGVIGTLAVVAMLLVRGALDQTSLSTGRKLAATLLMGTGLFEVRDSASPYFHEAWACVLILASLACHRPKRFVASVTLCVAACLFRETAALYLLVMFAFSVFERRWREAAAWAAGAAIFGAALGAHIYFAAQQRAPGDMASNGWLRFGGWPFILATLRTNDFIRFLPAWMVAVVACAAGLGLAGARDRWAARVAATTFAYVGVFAIIGRPDNGYWGLMYAPLLPLGLVYADGAIVDLVRRAATRQAHSPLPDRV